MKNDKSRPLMQHKMIALISVLIVLIFGSTEVAQGQDLLQELERAFAEEDYESVETLAATSCENGSALACNSIALLDFNGFGRPINRSKAAVLFRQSCQAKYLAACLNIIIEYQKGASDAFSVQDVNDALATAKSLPGIRDRSVKLCDDGFSLLCDVAAVSFYSGIDGDKDLASANSYYSKACELGRGSSCFSAGTILRNETFAGDQRLNMARAKFREACEESFAQGCFLLGAMQQRGEGGEVDLPSARISMGASCEGGYAQACAFVGDLYRKGLGGAENPAQARVFYQTGCDAEVSYACYVLSFVQSNGIGGAKDDLAARDHAYFSCEAGNKLGCSLLARLQQFGRGGEEDLIGAKRNYERACEIGHEPSCISLAFLPLYAEY